MKSLVLAVAALVSVPALARTVDVECTATVRGSSGSGQAFVFNDTADVSFETERSGSLRFFSAFAGRRQLQDSGRIQTRGESLPGQPGYLIYSGQDQVVRGTVSLAIPRGALERTRGTRFTGFFQSSETDAGGSQPIKLNLSMACRIL